MLSGTRSQDPPTLMSLHSWRKAHPSTQRLGRRACPVNVSSIPHRAWPSPRLLSGWRFYRPTARSRTAGQSMLTAASVELVVFAVAILSVLGQGPSCRRRVPVQSSPCGQKSSTTPAHPHTRASTHTPSRLPSFVPLVGCSAKCDRLAVLAVGRRTHARKRPACWLAARTNALFFSSSSAAAA